MARKLKVLITAAFAALVAFLSCSREPLTGPETGASGSLAPRILYKASAAAAPSFSIPSAGAYDVVINVQAAGGFNVVQTRPFAALSARFDNVPVGNATVSVRVRNSLMADLYTGSTTVNVTAGATARPEVVVSPAIESPVITTLTQACSIQVALGWSQTRTVDSFEIDVEYAYTSYTGWYLDHSYMLEPSECLVSGSNFFMRDSDNGLWADWVYRYHVRAWVGGRSGPWSAFDTITISNAYPACGSGGTSFDLTTRIFGAVEGTVIVRAYKAGYGSPSNAYLPATQAVRSATVNYDGNLAYCPVTLYSLPADSYWIYFTSSDTGVHDTSWGAAMKWRVRTKQLFSAPVSPDEITLYFSNSGFPVYDSVYGYVGGGAVSAPYYMRVYYNNETTLEYRMLGVYPCGVGGGSYGRLFIEDLPSLDSMASYFGLPYSTLDYYDAFIISDADNDGDFTAGDRYYYNAIDSLEFLEFPGDPKDGPINLGTVSCDSIYSGVLTKAVAGKRLARRM